MKITGTILDWIHHNPDAFITHPKLQGNVSVSQFKYYPEGLEITYQSAHANGPPMTPRFGPQAPYMIKGKVYFTALVFHEFYGCGAMQALDKSIAMDDGWAEFIYE